MEYTITNPPRKLALNDSVIFNVDGEDLKYRILSNFLVNIRSVNDAIFTKLGINHNKFCEEHYGYPLSRQYPRGWWPECKKDDFVALTRVVNALYELIRERRCEEDFAKEEDLPPRKKKRETELKDGDIITFLFKNGPNRTLIKYRVASSFGSDSLHLSISGGVDNAEIFNKLGLDDNEKYDWASRCYGYPTGDGRWPTTNPNDYPALERFIKDIRRVLREIEVMGQPIAQIPKSVILEIINKSHTHKSSSSINQVKQIENGKIIKTSRITPEIRRGEKIRGYRISGKTIRTSITVGHLSYATVTG